MEGGEVVVVEVVVEEVVVEGGEGRKRRERDVGPGCATRIYIAMPPSWRQKKAIVEGRGDGGEAGRGANAGMRRTGDGDLFDGEANLR